MGIREEVPVSANPEFAAWRRRQPLKRFAERVMLALIIAGIIALMVLVTVFGRIGQ